MATLVFSFQNDKIENLIGQRKFQTYNKLLARMFPGDNYSIYYIVRRLKNNGLLALFFRTPRLIQTKFVFHGGEDVLNTKVLNDTLFSLGYYYFYPKEIQKKGDKFSLDIEFKSEHYIDPVSFINEIKSRGCKTLDVSRKNGEYVYDLKCPQIYIKESKLLTSDEQSYTDNLGVYWIRNTDFSKISISADKHDYWHPSIWFYDANLNLINNYKKNRPTNNLTIKIPSECMYIKITDMYSGENFKRGIIVKGIK
jgi:hypothetical protein